MKKRLFLSTLLAALLLGGCLGSGGGTDEETGNETTATGETEGTLSTSLLKVHYSLLSTETTPVIKNLRLHDGTQPEEGTYLLTGTITIDQNNTDNRGDDGLILSISAEDGAFKQAYYIRYYDPNLQPSYAVNENFTDAERLRNFSDPTAPLLVGAVTVVSPDGTWSNRSSMIAVTDTAGTPQWVKFYTLDDGGSIEIKHLRNGGDGTFYAVGDATLKKTDGNLVTLGILLHIDATTGSVLNALSISTDTYYYNLGQGAAGGDDWHYSDMLVANDGLYLVGHSVNALYGNSALLVKLDSDMNFLWAKEFNRKIDEKRTYLCSSNGIQETPEGIFVLFEAHEDGTSFYQIGWARFDSDGTLQEAKTVGNSSPYSYYRSFEKSGNAQLFLMAGSTGDLLQMDEKGSPLKRNNTNVGGWKNGLFVDGSNLPLVLSSDLIGGNESSSYLTKFGYDLENCDTAAELPAMPVALSGSDFNITSFDTASNIAVHSLGITEDDTHVQFEAVPPTLIEVEPLCP